MLTDAQCQDLWDNASKENPIVIDSPEGKQVMQWLRRKNDEDRFTGTTFEVGSFKPFRSPVDNSIITNSKQLSAHNRFHDVEQVGDEYKNKRADEVRKKREEEAECRKYEKESGDAMSNPMVQRRFKELMERDAR